MHTKTPAMQANRKLMIVFYDCLITENAMEYTGPVSELKEMCEIRIEVAGINILLIECYS